MPSSRRCARPPSSSPFTLPERRAFPLRRRFGVFAGTLIGAGILAVAAVLPLPLYLIAPGSAIDLSSAVQVGSIERSRDRFFLTDVHLMRASPLRLPLALLPGVALVYENVVLPSGQNAAHFDAAMQRAMIRSQAIAAVVAERAAGLAVTPPAVRFAVESIDANSAARGLLAVGDVIRAVDGRMVTAGADIRAALAGARPRSWVRVSVERAGRTRVVRLRTMLLGGRTRLGLMLGERDGPARLAVPVRYAIGDVGGSSGGLMIALRIYESLRGPAAGVERRVAGTGTIAIDGRIGPIEGTRQKLIAAKRAGARIFFVPRANFADIAGERDVRVIPVDTFGQAVRDLDG